MTVFPSTGKEISVRFRTGEEAIVVEIVPVERDVEEADGNPDSFARQELGGEPPRERDAARPDPDENEAVGAALRLDDLLRHARHRTLHGGRVHQPDFAVRSRSVAHGGTARHHIRGAVRRQSREERNGQNPGMDVGIRRAAVLAAGAVVLWFALGMSRGVLLSDAVRGRVWPWAPSYPARALGASGLSDPVWQFAPWAEFAGAELRAGRLPLWNPHQDGGVPLLGNSVSAPARRSFSQRSRSASPRAGTSRSCCGSSSRSRAPGRSSGTAGGRPRRRRSAPSPTRSRARSSPGWAIRRPSPPLRFRSSFSSPGGSPGARPGGTPFSSRFRPPSSSPAVTRRRR